MKAVFFLSKSGKKYDYKPSYLYAIYTDNLVVVKSIISFVSEKAAKKRR